MNYDIVWNPSAENELAAIWLAADDRDVVNARPSGGSIFIWPGDH